MSTASRLDENRQSRTAAVRHAFLSGAAAKIITVLLSLVSVGIMIRAVGAAPYGLIATITGALGLFGFLDFGAGNALIGKVGSAKARGDQREIDVQVVNALALLALTTMLLLAATVVVVVALPAAALPGAGTVPEVESRGAIALFGVAVALAGPASIGAKVALGLQRGRENSVVAVCAAIAVLALTAAGQLFSAPLLYFVAVALLTPVLANAAQTVRFLGGSGFAGTARDARRATVLRMIPQGLPFTVLVVSGALSYETDMLVVTYVAGLAAAATYGLLTRVFSSLSVLLNGGVQQLWASTAHALEDGDTAWVAAALKKSLLVSGLGYAVLSAIAVVAAPWFLGIWTGGAVEAPIGLLIAFAVWYSYNYVMSLLSTLLNGAGKVVPQAIAASLMAVTNLPLGIWLTHSWGISGPLWASLITHGLFVGAPTVIMTRRLLKGHR